MEALAPIVVEDVGSADWDDASDVVVVGLGGAGVTAALEAREHGAEVVALDRFEGGGATAVSGGVFYGGGGSHIQREAGIEDSPENMYRYLALEVQDAVSEQTLRDFCEQSAGTVRWLVERGVPFRGSLFEGKTSYPPDAYHLYCSGNEMSAPWSDHAKPAARGHRTVGGSLPGAEFFAPLRDAALAAGVRLRLQCRVTRLVVDGDGRVVGAEYREIESGLWRALHRWLHRFDLGSYKLLGGPARWLRARASAIERAHARPRRIRARRGVVISSGGFVFDRQMVAEHVPAFLPGLPLGTAGDDGSGIRLGRSAGGAVDRLDRASAWRFLNPPEAFARGMLLDARGERFANEYWYGAKIGEAMVEERDGRATLILDETLRRQAREQVRPGRVQWFQRWSALVNLWLNCRRADDLAALARLLGVPQPRLEQSFAEYNAAAEGRRPDRFLKDPGSMQPLREGPFYAIDCSLGAARHPCAVMTLGGLVTDERTGAVRRPDGSAVPGLYAAGRSAVGICSRQYVSGLSIADCVYSGRRAGRHAASADTGR